MGQEQGSGLIPESLLSFESKVEDLKWFLFISLVCLFVNDVVLLFKFLLFLENKDTGLALGRD